MHPPAFTAQRLAKSLHLPGRQVVKSVLLASDRGYFLAVLPATSRVDIDYLSRHFDTEIVWRRNPNLRSSSAIASTAPTPFGRLYGMTTPLDDAIHPDTAIAFESQRHFLAIRMRCRDFIAIENPLRLPLRERDAISYP